MRTGHIRVSPIGQDRGTCTTEAEPWSPTVATTNQLAPLRSINQQPLDVSMNTGGGCCENYRLWTFARRCVDFLRSEEHTSELQSLTNLVCRLLLEKKKNRRLEH